MLRLMLTADYPCQLLYVSLRARHKQTHPETPISARYQVVIRKAFETTEADVKKSERGLGRTHPALWLHVLLYLTMTAYMTPS